MAFKLKIFKSSNEEKEYYGYHLVDDNDNVMISGVEFESSESIIKELTEITAALSSGLKNVENVGKV